jgi:hypothetical protein
MVNIKVNYKYNYFNIVINKLLYINKVFHFYIKCNHFTFVIILIYSV